MRAIGDIDNQYRAALGFAADVVDTHPEDNETRWILGVVAALAWVRGYVEESPASRDASLAWPSVAEIVTEHAIARAMQDGRQGHAAPWVCGVEQALVWVLGRSDRVPVPPQHW